MKKKTILLRSRSNPPLNGLRIRLAKASDASHLAKLSRQLGYPATARQVKQRLARLKRFSQQAVFVAESQVAKRQMEVVGWLHISVSPLLEMELRAEINGLVVAENQRNLGVGAKLLAAAEDWARKRGCQSMSVRSNVVRERAHKFYEREGYEHYKTQKAFRKPLR